MDRAAPRRLLEAECSDRALELERCTTTIVELIHAGARNHYNVGQALHAVYTNKLWRHKYSGFAEFLETGVDLSRGYAYRTMALAKRWPEAIHHKYGVVKLEAITKYFDEAQRDLPQNCEALGFVKIKYRASSGRLQSIAISRATTKQLKQARQLLRFRAQKRETATQRVERAQAALAQVRTQLRQLRAQEAAILAELRVAQNALEVKQMGAHQAKARQLRLLGHPDENSR